MRENTIREIESNKIIVILRSIGKEKLIPLAEALYSGGIRLIEVTFSVEARPSDAETAENIKMLAEHFAGRMQIGAGTVLNEEQVELVKKAGGSFIISPDTKPAVIKKTRECGLVSIPGAMTPTEILAASEAGADFVKLFPVSVLGAEYIKAVKAPLRHVKLLAVGGVGEENIRDYLSAGASGVGIGASLTDRALIAAGRFEVITENAKRCVERIEALG